VSWPQQDNRAPGYGGNPDDNQKDDGGPDEAS
jgi:hypothetical protein